MEDIKQRMESRLESDLELLEKHGDILIKNEIIPDAEVFITSIKEIIIKTSKIFKLEDFNPRYLEIIEVNYRYLIELFGDYSFYGFQNTQVKIDSLRRFVFENLFRVNNLRFVIELFEKFDFFQKNVVCVGANGSGKSSLVSKIINFSPIGIVTISAQKLLFVPTLQNIPVNQQSSENIHQELATLKDNKDQIFYSGRSINGNNALMTIALPLLIEYLIGENLSQSFKFKKAMENGEKFSEIPKSKLQECIDIWNELIIHRKIDCPDGNNLVVFDQGQQYHPNALSDGEKVILYYITHILLAPKNAIIFIDEPEMYLNKSILNRLWDKMELLRFDCIFVYLSHDLDFATSRKSSKKLWIKSYKNSSWEIENIPENELPEKLILELLGSRQNILFCESESEKYDPRLYEILFPDFNVKPVESCSNVINYTKAFNKLKSVSTKALGIIDRDYHSDERISSLEKKSIFAMKCAEIENLLLNEDLLKIIHAKVNCIDPEAVEKIKDSIFSELEKEKENQIALFITNQINNFMTDSHMSKGNSLKSVLSNFESFKEKINIEEWYNERRLIIEKIIEEKDYEAALRVFNHKGLQSFANKHLKISDFKERALEILSKDIEAQGILRDMFPKDIESIT